MDEGIMMDHEGWQSVTPEPIADQLAKKVFDQLTSQNRVTYTKRIQTAADVMCGVGGNVIAFARKGFKTQGVDICPEKVRITKNNCNVQGVSDRCTVILEDFLKWSEDFDKEVRNGTREKLDVVFLSPPWSGPGQKKGNGLFDLSALEPDLHTILTSCLKVTDSIALQMPRNFIPSHLAQTISLIPQLEGRALIELLQLRPDNLKATHIQLGKLFSQEISVKSCACLMHKQLRLDLYDHSDKNILARALYMCLNDLGVWETCLCIKATSLFSDTHNPFDKMDFIDDMKQSTLLSDKKEAIFFCLLRIMAKAKDSSKI